MENKSALPSSADTFRLLSEKMLKSNIQVSVKPNPTMQQIADTLQALAPKISNANESSVPYLEILAQETAAMWENTDIEQLINQAAFAISQDHSDDFLCTDPAELESDLQEFEETLNQASSKLPQNAVSSIKTGVITPLRSKPHLSRNDAIALFGIWISVILWMLSQSLPNKQLTLIHEDSVQIKEGLNQVIELDENLVNTAQVICDKLDALRTQGQDVRNLCDLTSNAKQPDSLQKAPNAQK